jgi:hypothetical protein
MPAVLLLIWPLFTSDNHTTLARMMVYEGGWTHEQEHLALAHTSARRWRHVWYPRSYAAYLRRYSTGLDPRKWRPNKRRVWVWDLNPNLLRPKHWPSGASWSKHTKHWRATLARAERFLKRETRDPCRGKPTHWAARWVDRPGWQRVACGRRVNVYYK